MIFMASKLGQANSFTNQSNLTIHIRYCTPYILYINNKICWNKWFDFGQVWTKSSFICYDFKIQHPLKIGGGDHGTLVASRADKIWIFWKNLIIVFLSSCQNLIFDNSWLKLEYGWVVEEFGGFLENWIFIMLLNFIYEYIVDGYLLKTFLKKNWRRWSQAWCKAGFWRISGGVLRKMSQKPLSFW